MKQIKLESYLQNNRPELFQNVSTIKEKERLRKSSKFIETKESMTIKHNV